VPIRLLSRRIWGTAGRFLAMSLYILEYLVFGEIKLDRELLVCRGDAFSPP
jgi:hypothetical protein